MKVFVDRAYPAGAARHHVSQGCSHHVGQNYYSRREVAELVSDAGKFGVDLAMHAMGDCAVDMVLDAFESTRRQQGDEGILRVEHAFVSRPGQGKRMASLGVDLVANPGLGMNDSPLFSAWRGSDQPHLKVLPLKSMIDAGARVSFASDHPCGVVSPAEIMWAARMRRNADGELFDPDEAVSGIEALRAYTINPALASGRGSEEGSIEVGKRANILVLDRDPVTCPADELRDLMVERTYVDGRLVHNRLPESTAHGKAPHSGASRP
ncbi:amidohydrolase family protein [Brevibacterium sanguinis]|uniref:Amidohydrolase family protein n=2 Tax=Brevibacterium TaxID=1696 RepID=A0A366INY6_9MICO|nr:amidohydrolase family protein [Brevibacterium sanguinis]RBP74778.1 amidohydrolase family protein [Brevibacterium celere]